MSNPAGNYVKSCEKFNNENSNNFITNILSKNNVSEYKYRAEPADEEIEGFDCLDSFINSEAFDNTFKVIKTIPLNFGSPIYVCELPSGGTFLYCLDVLEFPYFKNYADMEEYIKLIYSEYLASKK